MNVYLGIAGLLLVAAIAALCVWRALGRDRLERDIEWKQNGLFWQDIGEECLGPVNNSEVIPERTAKRNKRIAHVIDHEYVKRAFYRDGVKTPLKKQLTRRQREWLAWQNKKYEIEYNKDHPFYRSK